MADYRVTCINKLPRNDTHEGITHLGGNNWRWSREQVLQFIKSGQHSFHTLESGKRAEVRVVEGPKIPNPYLRTHADDVWRNDLLALPECPQQ
jgi:hypothetical protein